MARRQLTPALPRGSYPTLPISPTTADITYNNPGVASDGIGWINTGREILLVRNNTAGALTVTISSVPYLGRSGDITTYSVGANGFSWFGPFDPRGWNQAD